ncbi:hypothetical protein [Saccharomonospora piscinae]|uniref:Uncharacterized protein n=1 Tax=Saccharomonospora piscinae TaxID=687388 RepID=A0A1V9AC93_SACPI|nr:hypothetical protein [Saccharomonospora piscinae]OQO94710.1 hypothetical protein B1813_00990 [Saccharomonospora piscinae]TLW94586.1 hypothetical protein FFT09_01470 [Saccharomonospora piscinae]
MDGYRVEPDKLVTTGDELVGIADAAREAKAEFAGRVAAHEGANDGFTTTSKAASLAQAWESQIDDLGKRTAMAGGLLVDGAHGYAEMESAVLDTLPPLSSTE